MNISNNTVQNEKEVARLFSLLGQPVRLKILLLIGEGEACVCHLKAAFGLRQAYISQQLMALRAGGWLKTRRVGRNIYYSLKDPALLGLIHQAEKITNCFILLEEIPAVPGCPYQPGTCSSSEGRNISSDCGCQG